MAFRNLIVVIAVAILLVVAIAGEGYFYFYSQKQNDAANSVAQSIQIALKTKSTPNLLAEARSNLQAQTDRLREMQNSFPSSPVLDQAIKADVAAAAALAAKDDALAADPKLGVSTQPNIVALGQKATQALSYLQFLANTTASTVALSDAAQNAVELVAAYTKELSDYIDSLTPVNSGLSSGQIADYKSQVGDITRQVDSTENSLNQIDSIPASSVPGITSVSDIPSVSPTSTPTPDNNSGGSSSSSTSSAVAIATPTFTPTPSNSASGSSVTLGDIYNQQTVVTQTADEVNQLADQGITGNATSSGSSGSSSSSVDNGGGSNNSGGGNGDNNGGGGIQQSDTGQVKLIQGENTF